MPVSRPTCAAVEGDLIAVAMGEEEGESSQRVQAHVRVCASCREALEGYRAVDRLAGELRRSAPPPLALGHARAELTARLADLRARLLVYRIFSSPLGPILIARSEEGVSLVEYLDRAELGASRLSRVRGLEVAAGGAELEVLQRELVEYLEGRRPRLEWPLDWRLSRGEFDRRVLRATAAIPRGSVTSYAGLAGEVGRPDAVRAVAQALRWNPFPIVVPCHRVVGSDGSLTGYAGHQVGLKNRLLVLEGMHTTTRGRVPRVDRRANYLLTRGEREYCLPTCESVGSSSLARRMLFGSREHAEAAGYVPCTTCRPDLHPIARAATSQ